MKAELVGRAAGELWREHKQGFIVAAALMVVVSIFYGSPSSTTTASSATPIPTSTVAPASIDSPTQLPDLKVEFVSTKAAIEAVKPIVAGAPYVTPSKWVLRESIDPMTGKSERYADIDSNTPLDFKFPYQGPNHPSLRIQKRPGQPLAVILYVDKGQFLCHTDDCPVRIRFDDKQPIMFQGTRPADYSSTAIFISPAGKLVGLLKTAKSVNVQATFYQQGAPVMMFETAGLIWK